MADGEDVHLFDEARLVGSDELGEGDQGRPQLLPRVGEPHPRALLVGEQPVQKFSILLGMNDSEYFILVKKEL